MSLSGAPMPEAEYNFEKTAFTSEKRFKTIAQLLENMGVSAYGGAIAHIESSTTKPRGGLLTNGA
ncbi:MAG: ferritin-like domain-containing protein [Rubrobacter sp.]|nr:ferritin-like domain-containing protein [Rubrobacter sp.]